MSISRHSKGGCKILVLQIWPKCGQEGVKKPENFTDVLHEWSLLHANVERGKNELNLELELRLIILVSLIMCNIQISWAIWGTVFG